MTRLSELGESHIISRVLTGNPTSGNVIVGPGDDAAVTAPNGRLVSTADMLVENEDFTRDWLDWELLGRKAAAQNLADVCAMGALPHGLLVSLAVPADTDIASVEALYSGLIAEAERAGDELECTVPIIGGDLSSAGLIVVAITALGTVGETSAILRSGAQPGDSLYLAGTVGRAAAGLDLLFAGLRPGTAPPELSALITTQLAPRPDYGALLTLGAASAMIDVSDGLSTDLARIAAASGVGIDLDRALLQELIDPLLPAAEYVIAARADGAEVAPGPTVTADELAQSWVLDGGEDHGFAASALSSQCPGVGWRRIGEIRTGDDVSLDGTPVPTSGFSHFGK
ncbi:thiamine-phosphate kinase [Brevibacterium spongiae]|uniref:Thiamine-monophosphate kinase n=1 Tax=Brevibacterium spongiae TaxID=2909672 RepID=A0ABY5SK65_9MICO|nr:thiamine-phosphate kinase [Brevibacterium spongiae]UVI34903.1 thiamine-phosphate kinase [Brevibacterium spongiae]